MRGLAIIVLVGLTFWLFKTGWISLTFLPAIGIWYCIKTARSDPVDEIFAGGFFLVAVLCVAVVARVTYQWLEGLFGRL